MKFMVVFVGFHRTKLQVSFNRKAFSQISKTSRESMNQSMKAFEMVMKVRDRILEFSLPHSDIKFPRRLSFGQVEMQDCWFDPVCGDNLVH
jgi:hypothetical protein